MYTIVFQHIVRVTNNVVLTAADVMSEVTAKIEQLVLPEGYAWNVTGETEEESEVLLDLGVLAIVAVFLIFLLIVLQFNSLSIPVLVMSTVYLAIAGSLIGLFITSTPIGFMTVAGFIALAGIVVPSLYTVVAIQKEKKRAKKEAQNPLSI